MLTEQLFSVSFALGYEGYMSALDPVTKHHALGGLNKKNYFFLVLEAEKSRIKGLAMEVAFCRCLLACR